MPVIIAIAIRYVIMAAVQLGLWTLIEKYGLPMLNEGIIQLMDTFGLTREEAQDIMANKIIVAFEEVGIFAATLKTKLPIKVAEALGFTSKGWALRKIRTVAAVTAETQVAKVVVSKTAQTIITAAEAIPIVEAAKVSKLGFKPVYDIILKLVGVTFLGFMVVGNWIDFGNWNNGAYQKSMQKFIAWISFGALVPDEDYRKSLTVSDAIFSKIYNTFKLGGALGIQDPFKGVEVPFTRENLLDLTDKVGSTLLLTDGTASAKKVLAAVLPMIIFDPNADVDKAIASSAVASAVASQATIIPTITKVFTGIVSQGVVGAGLVFTPRPDDMIESIEELRSAASNNLAPFLQTLPGKIVYEVKVVSNIITKDGFKQTGTTQKIQTGTWANGTAKYKTVTNKFATLVVYALTDKGSRAKLTTIVLGPTNSAKLTVAQNDLQALQNELPSLVTTTDINAITNIQNTTDKFLQTTGKPNPNYIEPTTQPTTQQPVAPTPTVPAGKTIQISQAGMNFAMQYATEGSIPNIDGMAFRMTGGKLYRVSDGALAITTPVPASAPVTTPVVNNTGTTAKKPGASATTLYEWYQAQGQALPSVSKRSIIYEGKGLGSRSYYTGTSEQNTKLLNALKST